MKARNPDVGSRQEEATGEDVSHHGTAQPQPLLPKKNHHSMHPNTTIESTGSIDYTLTTQHALIGKVEVII